MVSEVSAGKSYFFPIFTLKIKLKVTQRIKHHLPLILQIIWWRGSVSSATVLLHGSWTHGQWSVFQAS